MTEVNEQLVQIMQEHTRVPVDGFVVCACGWEPNKPRKWSDAQLAAQADPELPDPIDPEGDYDLEHATDDAWLAHIAAAQAAVVAQ